MFETNIDLLHSAVQRHAFLIPVKKHRDENGAINTAQFKENWERQMDAFERMPLWEATPGWDDRDPLQREPYLVFIPANPPRAGGETILIAHGGGFEIRTGCEGPNVAWHFHQKGYHTAILTYRLRPYTRLHAMADMQRAIRLLRTRRAELGISGRVTVMGFSAGGMLAANCATHFDEGDPSAEDPVERRSCRPDAAVVAYGALTGVSFPLPFMMRWDPADLYGETMRERLYLAPEKNVRWDSPPFFIWQTLSDDGRYGLNLAGALSDAQIPYELHIFEGAVHGVGIADGENDLGMNAPHVARWTQLCDEWMSLHRSEDRKASGEVN